MNRVLHILLTVYTAYIFTVNFGFCANIIVANTNNSGAGSLRQAIADASTGDVITFSITGTISLTSAPLSVGNILTINGPGADQPDISGADERQVMIITTGIVTDSGLTLTDGNGGACEGGTLMVTGGTVIINDCEIKSGYSFSRGGYIYPQTAHRCLPLRHRGLPTIGVYPSDHPGDEHRNPCLVQPVGNVPGIAFRLQ